MYDEYSFSSLQAHIEEGLASEIISWGKENILEDQVYIEDPTCGRENEIHITILYGITTQKQDLIFNVLKNEKVFEVQLENITPFYQEYYDVIKIDINSKSLVRLHRIVENDISHKSIYKEFVPHITIAYVKKQCTQAILDKINKFHFQSRKVEINTLLFCPALQPRIKIKLLPQLL